MVMGAVFADFIAPSSPTALTGPFFESPSSSHILGTDRIGRDVFSRMLYGARFEMRIAIVGVTLGTGIGSFLGMSGAYAGGWVDLVFQRIMDVLLAIPALLLALVVAASLGRSANNATLAIAVIFIPTAARVTRSVVLQLKQKQFIESAQASGATGVRVLFRHIIPNAMDEVLVLFSIGLGAAIVISAALSFLGVGAQAPNPSWGGMLSEGRVSYERGPHLVWVPAAAISILVLAVNMVGDTMRDIMDPKVRGRGRAQF